MISKPLSEVAPTQTDTLPHGKRFREIALFFGVAFLLCVVVFGDAMLGRTLLAPVDIAPANWKEFRFVDPSSNGIPRNHHMVDQLTYDLPIQWTVYHAYRRGEIPWWDPYTYGGRPLLADAHISGTDPARIICDLLLPSFPLAYNWTAIAHFLIGGVGFYCLLRRFDVRRAVAAGIALSGMFGGCYVVEFSHPWIQASYVYYPWLWIAWDRLYERPTAAAILGAPACAAAILFAGNLQSHSYLVLFGLAFFGAYSLDKAGNWRRALSIVVTTGLFSGLIAAPVLLPELELFHLNQRNVFDETVRPKLWDGVASLFAVWPWALGTFRTVSYGFMPYLLFLGSPAAILALAGAFFPASHCSARVVRQCRCALALVLMFLLIVTIPLTARIFYFRCSGLALLGLIVLAGFGAEGVLREPKARWSAARGVIAFAILIIVGTSLGIFVIYPKIKQRLMQLMELHANDPHTEIHSLPLRRAQVENYGREIGFTNVEVLASWFGLVALVGVLAAPRSRRISMPLMLVLNLVGPVHFAARFIPKVTLIEWERLLAGGPEQRAARDLLNPGHLRLDDYAIPPVPGLFYKAFAHFYQVHVLHGYAALVPNTAPSAGDSSQFAEYRRIDGRFELQNPDKAARFRWMGAGRRPATITAETLNTIEVTIADGPEGLLRRSDTPYPGWRAIIDNGLEVPIVPDGKLFTGVRVPAGAHRIRFRYEPTGFRLGVVVSFCGSLGLVGLALWYRPAVARLSLGSFSRARGSIRSDSQNRRLAKPVHLLTPQMQRYWPE